MEFKKLKSRKLDGLGRVVLPEELRRQLGWNSNNYIKFEVKDGKMILSKDIISKS